MFFENRKVYVYRVEAIDGRGPWSSAKSPRWMYDLEPYEHNPGAYLPGHSAPKNALFAFINPNQMIKAFALSMLERAFKTSEWYVAVYSVSADAITVKDKHQITFDATKAARVRRIRAIEEVAAILDNHRSASCGED